MEYLLLASLWAAWCFLHSLMISLSFSGLVRKAAGPSFRFYRLFYVLVSLATVAPILWYSRSLGGRELFAWSGVSRAVQGALVLAALALFAAGARRYDSLRFLGIRQLAEKAPHGGLSGSGQLVTGGVLGVVRHPWYAGALAALWSRDIDTAVLVTNLVLSSYLVLGAFLEERKLVAEFGDEYRRYRGEVSMLVPVKWLKARLLR